MVVNSGIVAVKFDEQSFFSTVLGFTSGWDNKRYKEYTSQKVVNLSSTNKKHLKWDVVDGSVVNGSGEPIIYSFVLDEPSVYTVFCEPETFHFKKLNKSVLKTITFSLEVDKHEEVNFNGKTLHYKWSKLNILNEF